LRDKRFLIVVGLMALLAAQFWGGSRYPALNEKAAMGTENALAGLAFNPLLKIAPDETLVRRILYETINWTHTNRQGMTFGILFAALVMTLIPLFSRRGIRSSLGNTVMGMAIGTPMGVCANCAAPIGKAIHAAGGRAETVLAAMFSSPTLNVVILTMLFSLFPFYMGAIKVGLTVAFILIGIPLLTRLLHVSPVPVIRGGAGALTVAPEEPPAAAGKDPGLAASWLQAIGWVARTFAVNLWFIVKTTVPLMLLAGFLGSVVITLVPLESLADLFPTTGRKGALGLVVAALVGIFLPVPMSFDIIATAILWQAGMPVQYAMALLFTLGIFSVYPFFIIWRALGARMATCLIVGLAALGVVGGLMAEAYADWDAQRQQRLIVDAFGRASASLQGPTVMLVGSGPREETPDAALFASLQGSALVPRPETVAGPAGISMERLPLQAPSGPAGGSAPPGRLFTRLEGHQLGIDEPYSFSALTFFYPRAVFRGVASGDVHNDGWMDILLTTDSGVSLYANEGGKRFVRQRLDIPALQGVLVVNAALVDLDNDGWLDIYLSSYRNGNYVIYNTNGRFTPDRLVRLPGPEDDVMAGAAAFGDVDRDGNLDIVVGNWIHPCRFWMPCEDRADNNFLLRNAGGGRFEVQQPFRAVPGRQTLSLLLSDINADGKLDVVIGVEDPPPDAYFLGNGDGTFRQLARADGIIPHSAGSTMSVASADIANELRPSIYFGQITRMAGKHQSRRREAGPEACDEIVHPGHRKGCQEIMTVHQHMPGQTRNRDVSRCLSTPMDRYREDCIATFALFTAVESGSPDLCDRFPDRWKEFGLICRLGYKEAPKPDGSNPRRLKPADPAAIPIVGNNNVLLTPTGDGRFVDKAGPMGVQVAGFTWNARFADVDNDEFVDLYAVNGYFPGRNQQSHYFYRNEQGRRFVDATEEAGLLSYLATSAYTYVDLDNDGDLDIVAVPVVGPVVVYMNNSTRKRIAFELRDPAGNHYGIGSKVIIHYGPGGARHQMREIQASGGFISFDAPVAYFGLGDFDRVERVEVHWPSGRRSEIRGEFPAGSRYVIR
jgi:uncharacterized membrane protein YraQ (UPF0718 family)